MPGLNGRLAALERQFTPMTDAAADDYDRELTRRLLEKFADTANKLHAREIAELAIEADGRQGVHLSDESPAVQGVSDAMALAEKCGAWGTEAYRERFWGVLEWCLRRRMEASGEWPA